jgi:hypothetical protein
LHYWCHDSDSFGFGLIEIETLSDGGIKLVGEFVLEKLDVKVKVSEKGLIVLIDKQGRISFNVCKIILSLSLQKL